MTLPFHSVRGRLLLTAIAVEAVMLALMVFNSWRLMNDYLFDQVDVQAQQIGPILIAATVAPLAQLDYATVQAVLDESISRKGVRYLAVVDAQGNRVASSGWPPNQALPTSDKLSSLTDLSGSPTYHQRSSIAMYGQVLGQLHFGLDLSHIVVARRSVLFQSFLIAAVELILSLLLLTGLGLWMTRHLAALTRASQDVAAGNYSPTLVEEGDDELGQLGAAFNAMSRTIHDDVLELKQAKGAAEQARAVAEFANRAKSDFLATISHEIRTPMNGIIGMTELALDTELSADQHEYLTIVKSSADNLLRILNDILDFSKLDSGKMRLDLLEFDVRSLLMDVARQFSAEIAKKGIELIYEVDEAIPNILLGDAGRLRQVLAILLSNAVKFTEAGEIALRVNRKETLGDTTVLSFEVQDHGIGIASSHQTKIFEAFTQADSSTTRKYGGTGLGLAIGSQIVAAMGGKLDLQSTLGVGSVFSFDVPFEVASLELPAPSKADLKGVSVLIVDDNATSLKLLSRLVRTWEMNPTVADSAMQAFEIATLAKRQGQAFKLALLDGLMPDMDGFQLAEKFQATPELSDMGVMMLTSGGMRGDAQRCRELGVLAYLNKPIDQTELLHAINRALSAKADLALITRHTLKESRVQKQLLILLVEDSQATQEPLAALLFKWGHRVVLVEGGEQAVESSRHHAFDLILMDLQMAGMGGTEVTGLIRAREVEEGKHTPIIGIASGDTREDHQRCLAAGMDDCVVKPFDSERLLAVLASVLDPSAEPKPAPQVALVKPFDYAHALAEADAWIIETIGQDFLDDCPRQMKEMADAVEATDRASLRRAAHTVRGLVGNFNASRIQELAGDLEEHADEIDMAAAAALVSRIETEMGAFNKALVSFLEKATR